MKTCMIGVLVTMAGMAAAQPVQWRVEDGGNGHWYELTSSPTTWPAARTSALARGGDLAAWETTAEAQWCRGPFRGGYLLGGFQQQPAANPTANWFWVSGPRIVAQMICDDSPCYCCPGESGDQDFAHSVFGDETGTIIGDIGLPTPSCPDWMAALIEWSADCNNDGIVDKGQILSGQLPDTNDNGIPDSVVIATQPTEQNVEVDTPVSFVVEVGTDATCTVPVTYQWQRRNPLVADPAAPNAWIDLADGNGLFGTRAPNLTLLRPLPALATGYRCKIGGGCGCEPGQGGFVYTNTVNFSVACPADFNADGGIDFSDVEAFFERWENGC